MARERLMTIQEVAAFLRVSVSTVRRLGTGGGLPHYRFGKMVRVRRTELERWLDKHREGDWSTQLAPGSTDTAQMSLFPPHLAA